MRLSEVKSLKELLNDDMDNVRSFLDQIRMECQDDFEVDNYRVIAAHVIDEKLLEYWQDDLYVLGGSYPHFLAAVTGIDQEVFEAMQKAEAYEAIGKLLVKGDHMQNYLATFWQYGGTYGEVFNSWDGSEKTAELNGETYYLFRIN